MPAGLGTVHPGPALLSCCARPLVQGAKESWNAANTDDFMSRYSPIDRTQGEIALARFSGDDNTRPHKILWDLKHFLASKSIEGDEEAPLAVIGGGMSGLFTTFQFRKHKPVLLEQAVRFGGNAKGQTWRGMAYSLGSASVWN